MNKPFIAFIRDVAFCRISSNICSLAPLIGDKKVDLKGDFIRGTEVIQTVSGLSIPTKSSINHCRGNPDADRSLCSTGAQVEG